MSEPKLISPMLDNFAMGDPISDRNGVRCCPAMENDSKDKYIVKIISTPASQTQLDALLLSGAYGSKEEALSYYKTLTDGIVEEVEILKKLSQFDGFVPFESWQTVEMDDGNGFDVYMLRPYNMTLERYFRRYPMTHLGALNLGLDLCAALAVSRRSGYLFVDLKPSNIYITGENEYRIGDVGFLKLDSLKYASLPDRYRSAYTAPEIADAFSSISMTADVYAVGLILYQAFNDGLLPFHDDTAPADVFAPPVYADYEMSEIILKACSPDPDTRYQTPIELGQALVDYMQRNGAHDTPINPNCAVEEEPSDVEEQPLPETEELSADEEVAEEVPVEEAVAEEVPVEETAEDTASQDSETVIEPDEITDIESDMQEITEESIFTEDDEGNLTFLEDSEEDETSSDIDSSEIDYEEVTNEVSDMLSQADDLIAHQAPDPVVQPEPIDVPIPPPLELEEESAETSENEGIEEQSVEDEVEETETAENPVVTNKPKSHWLRNCVLAVMLLAIAAAGFFFYKNFYLQTIDAIILEQVEKDVLTVLVTSPVDETKLTVVCVDTYGNQLTSPVQDGKAVFTGLAPNSAYTVKVLINGFHRLTGDTSASYTTPIQTNVVQFKAITGSEDGSVILGFTVDGPEPSQWKILYSTADEEEKEIIFSGHMANLNGLTVGKAYTFNLLPVEDIYITGTTQTEYTASKIVKAERLHISGCVDDKLTVKWQSPEGSSVESWTVRCYNDSDFDQTIVVTETTAAFDGYDPSNSYTVEVTAQGMSVNERVYAAANSIAVQDFTVDDSDTNEITVTWTPNGSAPSEGWLLLYTVDGSATHEISCKDVNTAVISPKIPGAEYTFTLQAADGSPVLGGNRTHKTPAADSFSGYNVSAELMEFKMCKTPSKKKWDRHDLSKSDYTTEFSVDEKGSFLVRMRHEYDTSKDNIVTLFVIRDENGNIVSSATQSATWTSMWYKNYCELDIPQMPKAEGKYSIEVYFNGALANTQAFTIVP